MKIKALAALCAEAKELTLYDAADGSQWAGTGAVRYKLPESLGELSTNALCAIMDFGPDKLAKMRVNREPMTEAINTDDDAVGQKDLLYWLDRRLILDGRDVLPLIAPGVHPDTVSQAGQGRGAARARPPPDGRRHALRRVQGRAVRRRRDRADAPGPGACDMAERRAGRGNGQRWMTAAAGARFCATRRGRRT